MIETALLYFTLVGAPPLTYTKNVMPVFKKHCSQCHNPRVMGHLNWEDYATAYKFRERIKIRVRDKTMPPGGGTLTDQERVTIMNWVMQGAKK